MRLVLVAAIAPALATACLAARGSAQDVPLRPAEVAVSATGEARATPDRAVVTIGVQSQAATAAAAARANVATQRAVLDTLRAMGIRDDQLMTANYNVRPEYANQPNREGPPRVTGYVVSNTVQATLSDLARAGQVLDAALAKGANTVYGMSLTLADPAPARREALANAVAQARADAEALARAAGRTVGRLIELTTVPGSSGIVRGYASVAAGIAAAPAPTPIETGSARVTAMVTARWELLP